MASNQSHFRNSLTVLPTGRILLASKSSSELLVAFIEPDGGVTEGNGTITVPATFSQNFEGPPGISDGGDGAWVLCEVASLTDRNIAIVRVAADGSVLTVRTVCSATRDQTEGAMAPDGSGGVFVAWSDARDLSKSLDVYAAHLLPDGTRVPGWGIQGNPIASLAGDQFQPQIVLDGSGGAWLVWIDSRSGGNDIYFTHLGADGSPEAGFPAGGRPLCAATGSQVAPRIVADGEGGFYAVWSDGRGGGLDLYAQHIHSTGAVMPGWVGDGVAVCTEGSDQVSPALVLSSPHHALATWIDQRMGYHKVFAATLPLDAPVTGVPQQAPGMTFSIGAAHDPARGAVELTVSSSQEGEVRVTLHDVTGRVVGERVLQGPVNAATVRFTAERLGPGLYFARASRPGATTNARVSLVR